MEPFNFSFLGISGWGIDVDYCDIESFALEKSKTSQYVYFYLPFLSYCINYYFQYNFV